MQIVVPELTFHSQAAYTHAYEHSEDCQVNCMLLHTPASATGCPVTDNTQRSIVYHAGGAAQLLVTVTVACGIPLSHPQIQDLCDPDLKAHRPSVEPC